MAWIRVARHLSKNTRPLHYNYDIVVVSIVVPTIALGARVSLSLDYYLTCFGLLGLASYSLR
jgi:hypothetical protein